MNYLELPLTWYKTTDPYHPYHTDVDGNRWLLRINDFPEEPLYTLLIEGSAHLSFDDWPAAWKRLPPKIECDL